MDRHPLEDFWGSGADLGTLPQGKMKGRQADHDEGVAFMAPWEDPHSGFPEHARRSALALDAAGVPTHLRSFDVGTQLMAYGPGSAAVEKRVKHLLDKSIRRYAVMLSMFVPTETRLHNTIVHARMPAEELVVVNAHRILYNVWERQNVAESTVLSLNQVGQVWVACRANADMLERCGVKHEKIRVVPIPYFPDDPHLALSRRSRSSVKGLPIDCVRFYHIEKWEPRKEGRNIIGAFLKAFRPGEARLYFKSSMYSPKYPDYPLTPEHAVHYWLDQSDVRAMGWLPENVNTGIALIKKLLDDKAMLDLHRMGDVYVTMSRGEGWDMPAYDAKLSGNAMVYVPSGGPQDFACPDDIMVPASGTVPCNSWYQWGSDATCLDYKLEDAVSALRAARQRVLRSGRRPGYDLSHFRAELVGRDMRAYVEQLAGGSFG